MLSCLALMEMNENSSPVLNGIACIVIIKATESARTSSLAYWTRLKLSQPQRHLPSPSFLSFLKGVRERERKPPSQKNRGLALLLAVSMVIWVLGLSPGLSGAPIIDVLLLSPRTS